MRRCWKTRAFLAEVQTAPPDEFVRRAHSAHSIGRPIDLEVLPDSGQGVTSGGRHVATGNCRPDGVRRQLRNNTVRYVTEGATEISPSHTAVAAAWTLVRTLSRPQASPMC